MQRTMAFQIQLPAMELHDFIRQRQPDSRATHCLVGFIELLFDIGQVFCRDAAAIIAADKIGAAMKYSDGCCC